MEQFPKHLEPLRSSAQQARSPRQAGASTTQICSVLQQDHCKHKLDHTGLQEAHQPCGTALWQRSR